MATQSLSVVSLSKQNSKVSWERLPNESSRAHAAFIQFKELGFDRTYKEVAQKLKKSVQLIGRWGKKNNWHHRAADFDEYNEGELQRRLLLRRARSRERALAAAEMLDEKVAAAIEAMEITETIKEEGKPDRIRLLVSATEIARMFETSQKIQRDILGDGKEDRVAAIYVNFGQPNPKYDFEQPEAMAEARRRKALEAQNEEM